VGDDAGQPERITLVGSLDKDQWIKLPLAAMQTVGPAVQTLGGLLKVTNRETYICVADIASKARLPTATVRKHLRRLDEAGWIDNAGRQHTRRGAPRRTATIKITKQTIDHLEPYGMLPWWSCRKISYVEGRTKKVLRLPWCCRAVLSVWMARLCSLKSAAVAQQDAVTDEEYAGAIDNLGGDDRFRFSLRWLTEVTGLTRESVVFAKRFLNHKCGIVRWTGDKPQAGVTTTTDFLYPNWDFRVVSTPASEGRCSLAFDRGSENG
jgi:hypothetical protein